MFDISGNETQSEENSEMQKRDKGIDMNLLKNILISSPTLLTGMSHEMRTHMNAIVAFSFLMKDSSCNNTVREEYSNHILSSCEQLIELFDSFLDSAIIDTSISITESKNCKLDNILDDILSEFREELRKEEHKNVELITEIQNSNSEEVYIDTNKVFRVIRSLFQNSLKSTKSGYIKIGYYFRNEELTFYVIDSGNGFFKSKEFLNSTDLNKSLVQHDDTYTAINITLARKIIQMLNGTIWIECNGRTGTGIYFSIPARMLIKKDKKITKYANSLISI